MALLSLLDVYVSFGGPPVLDHLNLQIEEGERVCLLGRNGAGKTTLMRIAAGETQPDSGTVTQPAGVKVARLTQEIPEELPGTVREIVTSGLRDDDHAEDWEKDLRVDDLIARLGLPEDRAFNALSGGLKRRCLLAKALASAPGLLLLDEPTNHMDLDSILWMEEFLLEQKIPLLFVTHDRAFLRRMANRIIELDRGKLSSWSCDYDTYLVRKEELFVAEERQRAAFDKKLSQEEAWSRRSPGARRTKSNARMEALKKMRAERLTMRGATGSAKMEISEAERSGVRVVEAENIGFAYPGGQPVIRDFSIVLNRGDKVGLIGPNGTGKTTLVKMLLGQLAPTSGSIKFGTKLEVVYFDQMREQINDNLTVAENIAGDSDTVDVQGRSRHVISYLQDFLFEPTRARSKAKVLSGGERNRLLLARLFTKPANVLVLDEPTNDLDAETLDVLEDLLVEYSGTLIVVSHDRDFLDNVVTETLVFEGDGIVTEHAGGYTDWRNELARIAVAKRGTSAVLAAAKAAKPAGAPAAASPGAKLSNKERKEWETLPAKIDALEAEQAALTVQLGDPEIYKDGGAKAATLQKRLHALEAEHTQAFNRWAELDARKDA